jgi:hypothetical protein
LSLSLHFPKIKCQVLPIWISIDVTIAWSCSFLLVSVHCLIFRFLLVAPQITKF